MQVSSASTVRTFIWTEIFQKYQLTSKFQRKDSRSLCLSVSFHGMFESHIFFGAWFTKSITQVIVDLLSQVMQAIFQLQERAAFMGHRSNQNFVLKLWMGQVWVLLPRPVTFRAKETDSQEDLGFKLNQAARLRRETTYWCLVAEVCSRSHLAGG